MEIIDIGTSFKVLSLVGTDGFTFDPQKPPVCRLHNIQEGMYYDADGINIDTEENTCDVDWTADVTTNMIPGMYNLDVYVKDEDDNFIMLLHLDDYAKARVVSVSPGQDSGNQE